MSQPPSRTTTGLSRISKESRTGSFKAAAQRPRPRRQDPPLKEAQLTAYDLAIEDLREWLKFRFPNNKFDGEEVKLRGDKFVILIPEILTEDEVAAIDELRKPEPLPVEPDY